MARVLILFSSYDGQTGRIAKRIGTVLTSHGQRCTVCPAGIPALGHVIAGHDAVIVGSAIRFGRHAKSLERAVRDNGAMLGVLPSAFFSVCLSLAGPRPRPDLVQDANARFFRRSGWTPRDVRDFAGALPYRSYPPWLRLVMRFIVSRAGGDTDTSRNYEYTDWSAVDAFAADFARALQRASTPARAAA
jgi:menaquinone-dependent protoporphyrinogen oxidase